MAATYTVPLVIEYSNNQNIKQEPVNDIIGIKLDGRAKLTVADIKTDPTKVTAASEATLMIRIENSGTGDAESVKASVDLPFAGTKVVFLGKVETDDDALAVFILNPGSSGNFDYNLTVEYEDDFGEHTVGENLNIIIYPKNNGIGIWVWILVVGIISGIYWFFVRKREK